MTILALAVGVTLGWLLRQPRSRHDDAWTFTLPAHPSQPGFRPTPHLRLLDGSPWTDSEPWEHDGGGAA